MEFVRPIRWKEGLFLRPHHLQHHDLHLESRDIGYLRAVEPYAWGLIRLEILEDSLSNFVLACKALRAVLADGTLVDVPGNARLPSRTIDPRVGEAGGQIDVSIGVRQLEPRRPIAGPSDGAPAGQARFLTIDEELYDLDAGRDPVPVECLEYDLQFFLGDEPTLGFETLPVARIAATGNPARPLKHADVFSPPALVIGAANTLQTEARNVVERLATVLRKMDEVRGGDRVQELILFQALSGCFPVLKEMVHDGQTHPRRVYLEMARLAGTLYFRDETGRSFDEIPPYDHGDPGPVFETLRKLIVQLSEPVFERRYLRVPMERTGDQFRLRLPADAKRPGDRFLFEVQADASAPRVRGLLQGAKTSNPARIETLMKHVLPGIALEHQTSPPPVLGSSQAGTYFRLKIEEGSEWDAQVIPSGELVVFIVNAPQDVKINLIIVFPGVS